MKFSHTELMSEARELAAYMGGARNVTKKHCDEWADYGEPVAFDGDDLWDVILTLQKEAAELEAEIER